MTDHFEAKLHGFRRTQDGVVISYVVHPEDVSASMATAILGTRYMIAFSEIGDDEKPISVREISPQTTPFIEKVICKQFGELPLSQQSALRCNDTEFQHFLNDTKQGHKNPDWTPAAEVRFRCDVESRSEFDSNYDKGLMWRGIEEQFQAWNTDRKYGSSKR